MKCSDRNHNVFFVVKQEPKIGDRYQNSCYKKQVLNPLQEIQDEINNFNDIQKR